MRREAAGAAPSLFPRLAAGWAILAASGAQADVSLPKPGEDDKKVVPCPTQTAKDKEAKRTKKRSKRPEPPEIMGLLGSRVKPPDGPPGFKPGLGDEVIHPHAPWEPCRRNA
jgi:hypothetical protein